MNKDQAAKVLRAQGFFVVRVAEAKARSGEFAFIIATGLLQAERTVAYLVGPWCPVEVVRVAHNRAGDVIRYYVRL